MHAPPPNTPAIDRRAAPFAAWASTGRATLCFALAITALRLIYLLWFSPYALIEDEAHYWEWSRRLGLSYYSKGPGVAWTIGASTWLFGNSEFAVRFFGPISGLVTMLASAKIATVCFRDHRAGFAAACLVALAPAFQFGTLILTIDGPYTACWALACAGAATAMLDRRPSGWLLCGFGIALGFLYKYTILLLLPGLLIAWIWLRVARAPEKEPKPLWVLAGAAVACLGLLPVGIWNAQHDWATVRHLLGHLGVAGGDTAPSQHAYSPIWTLEYIGIQLAVAGPMLFLAIYAWFNTKHDTHPRRQGARFCAAISAPLLLFYFFVTFATRVEGNWPMASYITAFALAGWGATEGIDLARARIARWSLLDEPRPRWGILRRRPQTHRQIAWYAAIAYGLLSGLAMLRVDLLARAPGIGPVVPIGRLTSARPIAISVQDHLVQIQEETGQEPFFMAQHYGRTSLMAFYLPHQPVVYCASSLTAGRGTQYDHWIETDLTDERTIAALHGRPALVMGATQPQWERAFERVDPVGPVEGDHKDRPAFYAYGFKGFPSD